MRENPPVKAISKQQAVDAGFFGPVWHGTTQENIQSILEHGFRVTIGSELTGEMLHGYEASSYSHGYPAPIHHLGFGVYFTTVFAIAKRFNRLSAKGMREFYLDVDEVLEINFGSTNTMMKWWLANGYNIGDYMKPLGTGGPHLTYDWAEIQQARVAATMNMTEHLASQYDAVWFKGKGLKKLLDGDQICVYDTEAIYAVDKTLARGLDVGAKVAYNYGSAPKLNIHGHPMAFIPEPGIIGTIVGKRAIPEQAALDYHGGQTHFIEVKWKRGGTHYNYYPYNLIPVQKSER